MTRKSTEQDFWNKVDKSVPTGCWHWTGNIGPNGYGRMSQTSTHRYSYELHNGPIPAGLVVRHKCDNPGCCNPAHLEIGTKADNNRDRHVRGRSKSDKLTDAQAYDIKYNLRARDAIIKYSFVSEAGLIIRFRMVFQNEFS